MRNEGGVKCTPLDSSLGEMKVTCVHYEIKKEKLITEDHGVGGGGSGRAKERSSVSLNGAVERV